MLQAWLGKLCPLTHLENSLRDRAGEASYPGSFLGYWMQQLLYYDLPFWMFTVLYSAFAAIVLICWFLIKPAAFNKKPGRANC